MKSTLFSDYTMRLVPENIRHDLFVRANDESFDVKKVALLDIAILNHAVAAITRRDPNVIIGEQELDLFQSLTAKRKDYSAEEDRHHRFSMWNHYFHGAEITKCPKKKVVKITDAPSVRESPDSVAAEPEKGNGRATRRRTKAEKVKQTVMA